MTFTVLVVCSANVCRSPLAAALLEHSLASRAGARGIRVSSCGHSASPGDRACADMMRWAISHGLSADAVVKHRAALLDPERIDGADLVLAMDHRSRSAVLRLSPQAGGRTFTLREAATLSTYVPERADGFEPRDRLVGYVRDINGTRGLTDLAGVTAVRTLATPWRSIRVHAHDVPDAHRDVAVSHRLVRRLLVPAIDRLAGSLGAQLPRTV